MFFWIKYTTKYATKHTAVAVFATAVLFGVVLKSQKGPEILAQMNIAEKLYITTIIFITAFITSHMYSHFLRPWIL